MKTSEGYAPAFTDHLLKTSPSLFFSFRPCFVESAINISCKVFRSSPESKMYFCLGVTNVTRI